jgi:hypothetical protein
VGDRYRGLPPHEHNVRGGVPHQRDHARRAGKTPSTPACSWDIRARGSRPANFRRPPERRSALRRSDGCEEPFTTSIPGSRRRPRSRRIGCVPTCPARWKRPTRTTAAGAFYNREREQKSRQRGRFRSGSEPAAQTNNLRQPRDAQVRLTFQATEARTKSASSFTIRAAVLPGPKQRGFTSLRKRPIGDLPGCSEASRPTGRAR